MKERAPTESRTTFEHKATKAKAKASILHRYIHATASIDKGLQRTVVSLYILKASSHMKVFVRDNDMSQAAGVLKITLQREFFKNDLQHYAIPTNRRERKAMLSERKMKKKAGGRMKEQINLQHDQCPGCKVYRGQIHEPGCEYAVAPKRAAEEFYYCQCCGQPSIDHLQPT